MGLMVVRVINLLLQCSKSYQKRSETTNSMLPTHQANIDVTLVT